MTEENRLESASPVVNSVENQSHAVRPNNETDGSLPNGQQQLHVTGRQQLLIMIAFSFCNFCLGTGYAMLAPFFPKEAQNKGASPTVYGLIIGYYQLVVIIMSPVFGKLAPRLTPSLVACTGIFMSGVAEILFGLLEWCPPGKTFIIFAFLVRSFDALGWASYFTTSYSLVAIMFNERRATYLSLLETIFGLGMITGPALGAALYQLGGYFLPFVTIGSILLIGSVVCFLIIPTLHDMQEESPGTLRKLLKNPTYLADLFICANCFIGLGFNDATLEPHLREFHLKTVVLGAIFIVFGGVYAVGSAIWGYVCDKISNVLPLCAFGVTISFVAFLLIGPVPFIPLPTTIWLVCVAQVLLGIGMSAKLIGGFIHAMREALESGLPNDVTTYGAVFGTVTSASSLGAFIGPFLGGFLLEHVGYNVATVYVCGIELVTGIIVWTHAIHQVRKKSRKQKGDEEQPLVTEK